MSKPKFHSFIRILLFFIPLFVFTDCGTKRVVPITGRKYRVLENSYSDGQMLNMIKGDYANYVYYYGGDSNDKKEEARVKNVANRLIKATTDYLANNGYANELQFYEWEVHLVADKTTVNATCFPGGKITVFEGILPVAQNDAGLAAILGHEIGHAIAHHSAEKLTKAENKSLWQQLGAIGIGVAGTIMGQDAQTVSNVVNGTVGLSNEIMTFVEMKYSRNHEYEADHIGMVLMAMAGYDPQEAPLVWERMTQMYGDNDMRILSTHPSNKNRMKKMREKWMGEALSYYRNSSASPSGVVNTRNTVNTNSNFNSPTGNTGQYRVTANVLNVRSAPSATGTTILGGLRKGQTVTVIEITNGWAKINYNGRTGYVSADYIQK